MMRVNINSKDCRAATDWMSSFIDSMSTQEETERLHIHLAQCEPCQRQMQGLISLRNLMAGVEPVAVPEDLVLDTRVRLSHERSRNSRERWQARLDNIFKPFAVPAVMGIALSLFAFAILAGGLTSPRAVLADDDPGPFVSLYQPAGTTDSMIQHFGATISPELEQTLSVQTEVSNSGRVYDYSIITGTRSPGVDKWIRETLLLAQFRPATSWGTPVPSRMILSFVNVRG